jgi:hypothetical protein
VEQLHAFFQRSLDFLRWSEEVLTLDPQTMQDSTYRLMLIENAVFI